LVVVGLQKTVAAIAAVLLVVLLEDCLVEGGGLDAFELLLLDLLVELEFLHSLLVDA
jgi:hypothetical protein